MAEFKEKEIAKLNVKSLKTLPYLISIPTLMITYALFLYDRSLINYGFISLAFFILWLNKNIIHHFLSQKKYSSVILSDNKIILKTGGLIQEFQPSDSSIIIVNFYIFLKKNESYFIKSKKLNYYIGNIENSKELLTKARSLNFKIKVRNIFLKTDALFVVLICLAPLLDLFNYSTLTNVTLIISFFLMLTIIYRLFNKFYSKHFIISKETELFLRNLNLNAVLWLFFCIISIFPYTNRDQSLETLNTNFNLLIQEKDPVKKEKIIFSFNQNLLKFKTDYPDDSSIKSISNRFDQFQTRDIASKKL